MATQAASPEQFTYRTSPTVTEAFEGWLKDHAPDMPVHTDPWDVARADIYAEDRWQPIFAEMRAKAPVNFVKDSPYGPYWNVTTIKTIQHVEALPELFSSSWEHGGITITEPPVDFGSVAEVIALITKPRKWAPGLPVAADGFEATRYRK